MPSNLASRFKPGREPHGHSFFSLLWFVPLFLAIPFLVSFILLVFLQIQVSGVVLALFAGSYLVVSGLTVFLAKKRLVNPLLQLADHTGKLGKGEWTERILVSQKDEIGRLSYAVNRMAEDLERSFHSLEDSLERRSSQASITAELAALGAGGGSRNAALARAASIISERFGTLFVAIYRLDDAGRSLVLQQAECAVGQE